MYIFTLNKFNSPSKRDWLIKLKGWTPLRRNTIYGLCVSKSPHPSWAFVLLPISPPTIFLLVSQSTFSYFLLFSVLPNCFVPQFPSQNPVEHARCRSLPQRTSFPPVLPYIVDFTLIFLYCICNAFSSPFVLLEFSWKIYL